MTEKNRTASLSKQPNRTSPSFVLLKYKENEISINIPPLSCFPRVSKARLSTNMLLIKSPEWVCAERGEIREVRNDDPEDLVQCCNTHIPPGT